MRKNILLLIACVININAEEIHIFQNKNIHDCDNKNKALVKSMKVAADNHKYRKETKTYELCKQGDSMILKINTETMIKAY